MNLAQFHKTETMRTLTLTLTFFIISFMASSQVFIETISDLVSGKELHQSSKITLASSSGKNLASLRFQKHEGKAVHMIIEMVNPDFVRFDNGELVQFILDDGSLIQALSCNSYNDDGKLIVVLSDWKLESGKVEDLIHKRISKIRFSSMGRNFSFVINPKTDSELKSVLKFMRNEP